MKKVLLMAAFAVATLTANAQVYVGGNLGFGSSTDKSVTDTETTGTNFTIAPEVGYTLSDNLGIGILLSYTSNTGKTTYSGALSSLPSTESSSSTLKVQPYARYQVLKWGKANIFVDGGLNFETTTAKNMKSSLDLGVFLTPGFSFNVSEKISIVTKINSLFAFGFHKNAIAEAPAGVTQPDAPTSISADLAAGKFNVGTLTFGVFYNF